MPKISSFSSSVSFSENKISKSSLSRDIDFSSKSLPHSLEAEKSVLGCLLLDKDALIKIVDLLEPSDFYHDHHRFIYEAMVDLFYHSVPIDLVTVSTKLQAQEKLELVGGPEYLAEIQNEVPLATHVFQYAQIVKHRSTLRKLVKAGTDIAGLGYNAEKTAEELLEAAERRIFSISQTFIKDRFIPLKEILTASYERYCEVFENPELANAGKISTFFEDLDYKLNGGFTPSDLIIIAARPSIGKTALSLFMMMQAAVRSGKKVGIISLEMSREQLVERMLCSQLGIESWKLHRGKLEEADFERMGPVLERLSNAPIFIDDAMGSSIIELRAKARRLQMEYGLDILMIDYLQLMSSDNSANRVQEISEISRSLKELARELHIPVVAISQLNRGLEGRPDKRPVLSDLRDSGSIEQDADVVMMLYRDDYYNEDTEAKNELEIHLIKHRHGAVGRVYVEFDRAKMNFKSLKKQKVF